jgi:hypothetical protein
MPNFQKTSTSAADNSYAAWVQWKLGNPPGIRLDGTKTKATISEDGLTANSDIEDKMQWVFATEGFDISVDCQIEDKYDDTVLYYFEASQLSKSKW